MPNSNMRRQLGFVRHVVMTSGFAPTLLPYEGPINRVVELIKDGIGIGVEFGPSSLERLLSVAEFSEQSVYEKDSLRRIPSGVEFVLMNPPLRMGAYYGVSIYWDGEAIGPAQWRVAVGDDPPRIGSSVDRAHPLTFPVGVRSRIQLDLPEVSTRAHRVRLEFQNLAIPPRVWMDFHERVG